jgi:hypothetical protein
LLRVFGGGAPIEAEGADLQGHPANRKYSLHAKLEIQFFFDVKSFRGSNMWVPKSEEEIEKAINSGSLEETAIFDAKQALPSKNIEIAKDIAAMSNDGGVIIYGIGEDENNQLRNLAPFNLDGQPERIASIIQTSIAEPPQFHIYTITTKNDVAKGYIIVVVPPSERAPHMVIVNSDNRYYGRNAKGNILLTEAEVSRLYERRKNLDTNLRELLEKEIQSSLYSPHPDLGYLHFFIRPTFELPGILDKVASKEAPTMRILEDAVLNLANQHLLPVAYYPRFNSQINQWEFTSTGVRGKLSFDRSDGRDAAKDALILEIDSNGTAHLFCGRAAESTDENFYFFWPVVAGNVIDAMSMMGHIFQMANYAGMVDIGLAITGIKNAVYYPGDEQRYRYRGKKYEANDYKTIARIDAPSLLEPDLITSKTEEMLTQLLRALNQGSDNPFSRIKKKETTS